MTNKKFAASGLALAATMTLALSTGEASAQCGRASWYALHSRTANGERMNPSAMTAAHRSLPFGTKVKVTNQNERPQRGRSHQRPRAVREGPLPRSVARRCQAARLHFVGPHQRLHGQDLDGKL